MQSHDSSGIVIANHTGSSVSTSLLGPRFPLPSIQSFKDYQKLVLEILDRSDVEFLGGKRIVKRSGWRKLALAFQVSFECRSEVIEKDESGNVSYARFCQVGLSFLGDPVHLSPEHAALVLQRAIMPDGRFADGWGGCDRSEKRYARCCSVLSSHSALMTRSTEEVEERFLSHACLMRCLPGWRKYVVDPD